MHADYDLLTSAERGRTLNHRIAIHVLPFQWQIVRACDSFHSGQGFDAMNAVKHSRHLVSRTGAGIFAALE